MKYYVTKKASSMILRKPSRRQFLAGEEIPAEYLAHVSPADIQVHVKSGTLLEKDEDAPVDESDLGAPDVVEPVRIGTGQDDFMPEAQALPGERKDAALQELIEEQERRTEEEKKESELDEETGRTPDGVVQREEPEDEDDEEDDEYSDLSEEELEALRAAEGRNFDEDFDEDED